MFEQFGPYYRQAASEIQDPTNSTYERLWRDISGTFYIRHSDGTDEVFADAILAGSTVGDSANIGWNGNITNMNTTALYQVITGPAVTRQSFVGTSFVQANPNELSIKYVGPSGAKIRLEMVDTHSSAVNTFMTYKIFKNGLAIADSEFETPTNVNRNVGQTMTIETNAQTNDIFDVRAVSNAVASPTFRALSFIATKQKN